MKVRIIKYETYPIDNPNSYAVGFDISLENGRSFFMDTLVKMEDIGSGMIDEDIVSLAFNKIEESISEKVEELSYSKPIIIGTEFNIDSEYENSAIALKKEVDELVVKVDENTKSNEEIIEMQYSESLNLMLAITELYELTLTL